MRPNQQNEIDAAQAFFWFPGFVILWGETKQKKEHFHFRDALCT